MAQIDNRYAQVGTGARTDAAVDEGLRAYMLRVYNYMAAGVFLTGIVAYVTSAAITTGPTGAKALTQFGQLIYVSPLKWVIMLAPLAFVFFLSFRIYKMSVAAAQIAFWAIRWCDGACRCRRSSSFTRGSRSRRCSSSPRRLSAGSAFTATPPRGTCLVGARSFIMGVIGIIIAALVNLFLQSSALQFAISVIGVLVFAGLTAYDTQRIKDGYYEVMGDMTAMSKGAIMGALNLYLDFINMFVMLLQLFGRRQ